MVCFSSALNNAFQKVRKMRASFSCAFPFSNPLLLSMQSRYTQVLLLIIINHKLGGAAQFLAHAEQGGIS